MSIESAIEFVKKVSEDEGFKSSLEGTSKEEMLAISAGAGFDFTAEELEDVCEYAKEQGEELDIEELEKVVGGIAFTTGVAVAGLGIAFHGMGKSEGWW